MEKMKVHLHTLLFDGGEDEFFMQKYEAPLAPRTRRTRICSRYENKSQEHERMAKKPVDSSLEEYDGNVESQADRALPVLWDHP